jgi:superfamily II DNA or RNA helicase
MNRPYQGKALDGAHARWQAGVYRQLHVMATGTGKTHCFAQLPKVFANDLPGKMLVLAHREELIDQAIAKIQAENPLKRIDKEKAAHVADPSRADIVVASVASLNNRLLKYDWNQFDKFVIDEAHHSTADSYMKILNDARMFDLELPGRPGEINKRLLTGWTATPQRGDGEALAKVYQEIVTVYTIREAIEDGWLVDVRGFRVRTDTSLDAVKVTAGDFNQGQLADAVNTPERNMQAYKAWMKLAEDRQTIGFCVDIQHAQDMAALFRKHDVLAEAIWGDDPDRKKKLDLFRAGEIEVLFNCDILTEGFDMWQVECILNLGPTKSPVKYVQRVGRGTRLEAEIGNLLDARRGHDHLTPGYPQPYPFKTDCIVIDLVDNCTRNSLITLPTLMGLPNSMDLQGKSMVWAVKQIEEAQEQFPHLDLTGVPSIDGLKSWIQEVNLFDVVFRKEVEEGSELSWHATADGGYVLLLPSREEFVNGERTKVRESVTIKQNLLDKFEIATVLDGKKHKGYRETLADAFKAADALVMSKRSQSFRLVKQKQEWHNEPATDAQRKTLKKFMKGKQIPVDLNKGKASRLISAYIAGKN